MTGLVYLIGAGPGDSKLITVKGKECIERADVICYAKNILCTNGKLTNYW